jgi:hypothetical protein
MTAEQFRKYWSDNYPDADPIGYELKWVYEDRWFRIHSLPESKRYADNENEYSIILDRQNSLISDIFGDNQDFIILIGLYTDDLTTENYEDLDYINQYTKVDTLDLHKLRPEQYEDEIYYDIFIRTAKWKKHSQDKIMRKIADDEIRAIFINPGAEIIICPYDGGVDIILKDAETRDQLKRKYTDWLSNREDGL